MSIAAHEIVTEAGPLSLREEKASDAAFLEGLFAANNAGLLQAAGLPQNMIDQLLGMQYCSQSGTYRAQYPYGRFCIVERDKVPIGRLVTHDEPDAISIVDIALLPSVQGRGIGSELLAAIVTEAASRGVGARAMVMVTNRHSLTMFQRLGFIPAGRGDGAHVVLQWKPPAT